MKYPSEHVVRFLEFCKAYIGARELTTSTALVFNAEDGQDLSTALSYGVKNLVGLGAVDAESFKLPKNIDLKAAKEFAYYQNDDPAWMKRKYDIIIMRGFLEFTTGDYREILKKVSALGTKKSAFMLMLPQDAPFLVSQMRDTFKDATEIKVREYDVSAPQKTMLKRFWRKNATITNMNNMFKMEKYEPVYHEKEVRDTWRLVRRNIEWRRMWGRWIFWFAKP